MKIALESWSIKKILKEKDKIDPKPQYQRTEVWSKSKKKLLIDSILRGYDLPKFYLSETPLSQNYDYEVTDGQQRLRTIWQFAGNDETQFDLDKAIIDGVNIDGLSFADIKLHYKDSLLKKFLDFQLSIAIIKAADSDEIRSLFSRLQMGEKLKPVELRHALASNIGSIIFSISENHVFFSNSRIPNSRYKHQDYLDHAFLLALNGLEKNLKASDLKTMYVKYANTNFVDLQPIPKKINDVLDMMDRVNSHNKGAFKNKWGFVDTFYLLFDNIDNIEDIKPINFAKSFSEFESKRKNYNREPEKLIENKSSLEYDKDTYDYIMAFKSGGNQKENVGIRYRVFFKKFFNDHNFKLK